MPLKLYSNIISPPVRAVLFALKTLNLPFEEQHVDVQIGDNMTEEYLKINPAHTIPTLVEDDDFVVFDSHAINAYLVNKYAENDELYPSNCQERSVVDRAMYFECGTMFCALRAGFIMVPVDTDKFPLLAAYMERCQSNLQGYAEVNEPGLEILRSLVAGMDLQLPSE